METPKLSIFQLRHRQGQHVMRLFSERIKDRTWEMAEIEPTTVGDLILHVLSIYMVSRRSSLKLQTFLLDPSN